MQQMDLFENLDFGPFQALARMVKAPNFDVSNITTLDFSNTKYPNVPSWKILEKFTELRVILLNNTGLSGFDAQNLIKGAPLLREINLSGNNITEFDDVIELGKLKYLQSLNLQDNPISKNYIRIKFIEFLLFPSKYKPYNPVKTFTATYEQIPNKAGVTAESVAESNKFYRFLEKGDEEMKLEAATNTLVSKYDHQKTIIKLSAETCPVPRKTNFPMLTLLNNEKITIQNLQSILMTNDISSILEIYEEHDKTDEAKEKPQPKRKNKKLHKKYIKDYLRRKMRKEFIAEQEDKKKMNFDTLDDDPLKTLDMWKQKIGPDGKVLKDIDYQKELWKRPADLEHKDAEFNIGISEYKQMVREYEEMKKQKSGRKMTEEEEKEYREIKKLFPEKKKRKDRIKIKFGGEVNYTVEQNTSDSDVQENQDEDEKEEWHESDFWFDSDDDEQTDPNIWEDLSTLSKRSNSSPMNKRNGGASPSNNMTRILKRMSIMKGMHQKNKESDQSRGGGDMVIQEEENEENTNRDKGLMMEKIRIPNLVPSMDREEFEQIIDKINKVTEEDDRRKNMSKTFQTQTRKARTFLVKKESKPNFSLPLYPRARDETAVLEKSQEPEQQQQLTERIRREATPVSISVSEKKLEQREEKKGLQRGASDLDILKALVDNKGSVGMFITQQISAKQSAKFMIKNEEKEVGKIGIQDTAYDRVAKKIKSRGGSFDKEFIESLQPTSSYNHTVGPTDYSDSKIKPREEVKAQKMLGERRGSSKILQGIVKGGGSQSMSSVVQLPKNPQNLLESNDKETFLKATYQKALSFLTNSIDHRHPVTAQKTQKTTTVGLEDSDPLYAIKFQASVNSPSPDNQSTKSPVNNQSSTQSFGTLGGPYFRTPAPATTTNKILNFPEITPNKTVKSFIPGFKNNFETPEKTENPDPKNHSEKKQLELRKKAQKAWENDRSEIPTLKPIKPPKTPNKNSQITPHNRSTSNLKAPLRANHQIKSSISQPQLLNLPSSEGRLVPAERLHSQPGADNLTYGTRSPLTLLSLESPTHLYYGRGAEEISNKSISTLPNLPSYDQSPINRKIAPIQPSKGGIQISNNPNMIISILNQMNGKGKEIRGAGGRVIKFTDSIYIQNGERATNAAPRTLVEDLIPGPEAGISAKKKMGMLHSGYSRYNKILETAKMLDDTTKIIEDSKDLAENVIRTCKFKKRVRGSSAIKPREPREISYEELTQFLRLYKGQEKLTFDDDKDVRRLADAINDYELQDNKGMKMTEVEQKLRKLRDETLKLEGAALEAKFKEIERCREYLELLENIEEHRDAVRNSNRVDKLQAKEIERAEHNAILAVHYMKLRKYCDSEYLGQFMNSDFKVFESIQEARMNGNNAGETQEQQDSRANKGPALYKGKKVNSEEEAAKASARKSNRNKPEEPKEKGLKRQETLMEYVEKVNEEKKAMLKEYPYVRQESEAVDDQHAWLHYSPVAKFEIKPMLGIEALMEEEMKKKQSAYTKSSSRMMTTEEKAVQYAEEFKEGLKERKVLKNRVEKYIKQGTVHIDEMLENEKKEIDERNNKKKMFREYMNMLYEKNKGTVAQSPRSSLMMMSGVMGSGIGK